MITRVAQRLLALTAAIWHNDRTQQPVRRSLLAYDHLPLGHTDQALVVVKYSRFSEPGGE